MHLSRACQVQTRTMTETPTPKSNITFQCMSPDAQHPVHATSIRHYRRTLHCPGSTVHFLQIPDFLRTSTDSKKSQPEISAKTRRRRQCMRRRCPPQPTCYVDAQTYQRTRGSNPSGRALLWNARRSLALPKYDLVVVHLVLESLRRQRTCSVVDMTP